MFTIRIADTFIQINERYQYIKQYCRNYIVDDVTPELVIKVSDEEINAEQSDEYVCSPDYLETLAVYRKICERLVDKGIILVHSSVLMVDGEAVMFLAPSGTGKSTHTRLWRQVYGDRVTMINDDKPLVSVTTDDSEVHVNVYGTPWCGKHGIENNKDTVVGIATKYYRKGRWIDADDIRLKIYAHIWCDALPVRRAILRLRDEAKKVLRRVRKLWTKNRSSN